MMRQTAWLAGILFILYASSFAYGVISRSLDPLTIWMLIGAMLLLGRCTAGWWMLIIGLLYSTTALLVAVFYSGMTILAFGRVVSGTAASIVGSSIAGVYLAILVCLLIDAPWGWISRRGNGTELDGR